MCAKISGILDVAGSDARVLFLSPGGRFVGRPIDSQVLYLGWGPEDIP